MLGIKGTMRVWYIPNVTDMRLGKYRLLQIVRQKGFDPYNGDIYLFMSGNRHLLRMVRCEGDRIVLYDVTYMSGYRFLKPVFDGQETRLWLDYRYLSALLNCPEKKELYIAANNCQSIN